MKKDDELPKTMIVNKSTSSGFDTWEPKDQKKVDRIVGNKKTVFPKYMGKNGRLTAPIRDDFKLLESAADTPQEKAQFRKIRRDAKKRIRETKRKEVETPELQLTPMVPLILPSQQKADDNELDLKFKKLMQPTPDPELFKGLGSLFKSKTKGKI